MSSFIVAKKVFDLSASADPKVLVGVSRFDFSDSSDPKVKILKKHFDYTVDVAFDANDGSVSPSSKTYVVGKAYGDLPTPTKASSRFDGWWTKKLVSFANTGTVKGSCFKCNLPSGYSPVGTTMTFWGKNLGRTSVMPDDDASMFFMMGNGNGIGIGWQHNNNSTKFSLLKEVVAWQETTVAGLDSWHHYAVVYSSQSNIQVYIDGVLKISGGNNMRLPTDYFGICGYPTDINYRILNGSMARVAIFNSALTQAQIQTDMELGEALPDFSQLQHLWAYSIEDEIGDWNLTQVGPAYINNETPWESSIQITEQSIADLQLTQLYAHWTEIDFSNGTEFDVVTTSSYKKTGIYSATRYSALSSIYVDWGDGTMDEVDGNISQLAHEYSSVGTFRVRVTDNITSFAPSYNNSTWYSTTSQNRYTFKNMAKTGSRCTSMPIYAFYYCSALSSIDFLSSCWMSLTSLPNSAFYYCTGLTQLSGLPARIKTLGSSCFRYCTGLTGIQDLRNTGLTSLYNSQTFGQCQNVQEWKLPSTLSGSYFGTYQFYYNSKLSAIQLPQQLTSIPNYCFRYCQQLKNITIPSKVTNIGMYAFSECYQLSSVSYETTALTSVGNYAFYSDYRLQDINVPDTVKTIGPDAFYGCYSSYASALTLPSALTALGTYAYQYCYNLKTLSIPSGLASIGDQAFAGCRALSSISDYRLTAQTVGANTFGNTTGTGTAAYTGYNTRGSNDLSVYWDATGYDSGYWLDPLQNQDKCGFNIKYLDPEHISWCDVTFDARCCGEINGSRTAQRQIGQGKSMGELYSPTATTEDISFEGWYTGIDGAGTKYEDGATCPQQDSLQLYAHWQVQSGGSWQTYDTHEMLDVGSGNVLAVEEKDKVIKLEQYT